MGRAGFATSIAINAALLGLISTAVLVTALLEPSETALGWGVIWAVSLPLVALLAAVALFAYPAYLSAPSGPRRISLYCLLVLGVAALAYGTTWAAWALLP